MNVFKPEVFQGNLKKTNYFEGWYFKNVSLDKNMIYSFIPGVSLDKKDPHAFIQIIDGITHKTHFVRFDIKDFFTSKKEFFVTIGNNEFSKDYICLDIDTEDIKIKGTLEYSGLSRLPATIASPGIMGWFSYIPFMECNHGIVSADHSIQGDLQINGVKCDFTGGRGYIEKDWGRSFPEAWIWMQCNNFKSDKTSIFLSIAKIPWLGHHFMGFICFVYINGVFYKFATYNGAKIKFLNFSESVLLVSLVSRKYKLVIKAKRIGGGNLKAPETGNMSRIIKESVNSEVEFELFRNNGGLIQRGEGQAAGLEIIESIFEYFAKK